MKICVLSKKYVDAWIFIKYSETTLKPSQRLACRQSNYDERDRSRFDENRCQNDIQATIMEIILCWVVKGSSTPIE